MVAGAGWVGVGVVAKAMKRIIHRGLITLAAFPWALGCSLFAAAYWMCVAADRLLPGATSGNCWSHAGVKWGREGGYLLVRWSDYVPVLHVLHVSSLDPLEMSAFVPTRKLVGWRGVLWSLYHEGRIDVKDVRRRRS